MATNAHNEHLRFATAPCTVCHAIQTALTHINRSVNFTGALVTYSLGASPAIGGAAQFYARCLPKVQTVYLLEELGVPEAMWHFVARDFMAIVTMDSHGNSLHEDVLKMTGEELEKVMATAGG